MGFFHNKRAFECWFPFGKEAPDSLVCNTVFLLFDFQYPIQNGAIQKPLCVINIVFPGGLVLRYLESLVLAALLVDRKEFAEQRSVSRVQKVETIAKVNKRSNNSRIFDF